MPAWRTLFGVVLVASACANANVNEGDDDDDDDTVDAPENADVDAPSLVDARPPVDAPGPDAAEMPACMLVPQSGCTAGQACDLDGDNLSTGGTLCRDVTTPGDDDDVCMFLEDCAAGWVCVGGADTSCMEYCANDSDCTAPGGKCLIELIDGAMMPIPGAKVCTQNCDPMNSTGCPPAWGCHIYSDAVTMANLTSCSTVGTAGQGVACASDDDCLQNHSCFNTGAGGNKCLQHCRRTAPASACPGATTCTATDPATMLGAVEYGACL